MGRVHKDDQLDMWVRLRERANGHKHQVKNMMETMWHWMIRLYNPLCSIGNDYYSQIHLPNAWYKWVMAMVVICICGKLARHKMITRM